MLINALCHSANKNKTSLKDHFAQQPKETLETRLVCLHDKGHNLTKVTEGEWCYLWHVTTELLLQIVLTAATLPR